MLFTIKNFIKIIKTNKKNTTKSNNNGESDHNNPSSSITRENRLRLCAKTHFKKTSRFLYPELPRYVPNIGSPGTKRRNIC